MGVCDPAHQNQELVGISEARNSVSNCANGRFIARKVNF